jgi:ParB-like chromosome segregation protein Spo0J
MRPLRVYVDGVTIGDRRREADTGKVSVLAESMGALGLQQPITVRVVPDENGVNDVLLVTGLHRLKAAEKLGWDQIDALEVDLDDIDCQLWEIAENLHRAELTALQRSEQIAEWSRLMAAKQEKAAQLAQVSGETHKGGRGNKGGVSEASRQLGIDRDKVRRAVNIATKLTPEAKALAVEYGMADNQSALERIARAGKDAESQREEVERIEDERVQREKAKANKPRTLNVTPMPPPQPPEVAEWSEADEEIFVKVIDLLEKHDRVRVAVADYLAGRQMKTAP